MGNRAHDYDGVKVMNVSSRLKDLFTNPNMHAQLLVNNLSEIGIPSVPVSDDIVLLISGHSLYKAFGPNKLWCWAPEYALKLSAMVEYGYCYADTFLLTPKLFEAVDDLVPLFNLNDRSEDDDHVMSGEFLAEFLLNDFRLDVNFSGGYLFSERQKLIFLDFVSCLDDNS